MTFYGYRKPYSYPYGKYVIIKKFIKLDEHVLKKSEEVVSFLEIKTDELGQTFILLKKDAPFSHPQDTIEDELRKNCGNLLEGYEWLKESEEGEESIRYLVNQYRLAGVALRLFGKLSSIEAAFEAAFFEKHRFRTKGVPLHMVIPVKTKSEFLDVYILPNCRNIYLAVKYLEQRGLSKNPVKDKELVSKIQKGMGKLEKDMKKRNLTKEEWEAREKTKHRYYV